MMSGWLIRVHNGSAYIWKRKFLLGAVAIPWRFHGGTRIVMTPDAHDNVLAGAMDYIKEQEPTPYVTIHFIPQGRL